MEGGGLELGKERDKCFNYIIISNIKIIEKSYQVTSSPTQDMRSAI